VLHAEAIRSIPCKIRFGHRERRVGIMGLSNHREFYRLMDVNEREIALPAEGLLLSQKLADLIGATAGDVVTVEVLEGKRPTLELPVSELMVDYSGTNAYMEEGALHRALQEGRTLTGAFLAVDTRALQDLYQQLKATPQIGDVSVKAAALESFRNTVAQNQLTMQTFNLIFACIIAFGVVYNTARISLSERGRELATLRVIGFTRGEISGILLGELALLTLTAIPIGMVVGYGFAALIVWAFESELYTYGFAAAVTMFASLLSGLVVRRRLDRLDLVAVLKSKE
jgi:putative ABC transport system permease protein